MKSLLAPSSGRRWRTAAACLLTLFALISVPGARAQAVAGVTASPKGRPVLVFVHGRNQMYKDAIELDSVWFRGFRNGLAAAGLGGLLEGTDLRMVRYAKVFESRYPISNTCRVGPHAKGPALVNKFAASADSILASVGVLDERSSTVETSPSEASGVFKPQSFPPIARKSAPSDRAIARAEAALKDLERQYETDLALLDEGERLRAIGLDRIIMMFRDGLQKVVSPALALKFLKDTRAYLSIGPETCETDEILNAELTALSAQGRPVVLVAHSMGAMVAYRVIALRPANLRFSLNGFVTIGAQLGWDQIPPYLLGSAAVQPFRWPERTDEWTNITGRNDPLGFAVAGQFGGNNGKPWVHQKTIETGGTTVAHDASQYLSSVFVASRVAALWCRAFREPATPPPACRSAFATSDAP